MDRRKSLRQLAKELGVSASYLSQVRHGKCPPSERLRGLLSKCEVNPLWDRTENPRVISSTLILGTILS
jgi:transcriptional regulator with XRE-family HTH domain